MKFKVEWSETEGLEGPWQDCGEIDATGDNAGAEAVDKLGEYAGLYRVRPSAHPHVRHAYYLRGLDGRVEWREFPP